MGPLASPSRFFSIALITWHLSYLCMFLYCCLFPLLKWELLGSRATFSLVHHRISGALTGSRHSVTICWQHGRMNEGDPKGGLGKVSLDRGFLPQLPPAHVAGMHSPHFVIIAGKDSSGKQTSLRTIAIWSRWLGVKAIPIWPRYQP